MNPELKWEVFYPHPPLRVSEALTDPAALSEWLQPAEAGIGYRIVETVEHQSRSYSWITGDCDTFLTVELMGGSPLTDGGTSAIVELLVEDVDAAYQRALDAGANVKFRPDDSFYGDRVGHFTDPFGHTWSLSTVKEVLTAEELYHRMLEHFAPQGV